MSRFYSLVAGLKGFGVAFQSNVPEGEPMEKYLTNLTDSVIINEEKRQIFHPADIQQNGRFAKVIFHPATNGLEHRKLVFFSQHLATCGRFGEVQPFGFEKCQPGPSYRGFDYVGLAYPGITGRFTSLYIKVEPRKKLPLMIKVSVEEKNNNIVVTAEKVFPNQLPKCMKNRR